MADKGFLGKLQSSNNQTIIVTAKNIKNMKKYQNLINSAYEFKNGSLEKILPITSSLNIEQQKSSSVPKEDGNEKKTNIY